MPGATPVTLPDVPIVATPVAVLLQVPPAVEILKDMVSPSQTVPGPAIAATVGRGLIVIIFVAVTEPHTLLTV